LVTTDGHRLFASDAFTNPAHVHFALKVTLVAMFCYIVYEGNRLVWNPHGSIPKRLAGADRDYSDPEKVTCKGGSASPKTMGNRIAAGAVVWRQRASLCQRALATASWLAAFHVGVPNAPGGRVPPFH